MSESREPTDPPSDDFKNGFILSEIFMPETVLEIFLSYVPISDILKLTQVCQLWKDIVCRRSWWKKVFERNGLSLNWTRIPDVVMKKEEAWFHLFCLAKVFTKNLVQNHSGHDQLSHWKVYEGEGEKMIVESPPVGVCPLPADPRFNGEVDSAFVTSFGWGAIRQKINLMEVGLTPDIMKAMIPFQFVLSKMVGIRYDCGGVYCVCLSLMDSDNKFGRNTMYAVNREAGGGWTQASCTIDIFEPTQLDSVRYLVVMIKGKDKPYWAGNYGPKFSRIAITTRCLALQEAENMPLQKFDTRISQEVRERFFGDDLWSSGDEHFESDEDESESDDDIFWSEEDDDEYEWDDDGEFETEDDEKFESKDDDGVSESKDDDSGSEDDDSGSEDDEPHTKRRLID